MNSINRTQDLILEHKWRCAAGIVITIGLLVCAILTAMAPFPGDVSYGHSLYCIGCGLGLAFIAYSLGNLRQLNREIQRQKNPALRYVMLNA